MDLNARGRCFSTFLPVGVKVSAYAQKKKTTERKENVLLRVWATFNAKVLLINKRKKCKTGKNDNLFTTLLKFGAKVAPFARKNPPSQQLPSCLTVV